MLGGADNPNGELPSYITGADTLSNIKTNRLQTTTIIAPHETDACVSFPRDSASREGNFLGRPLTRTEQ